MSQVKKLAAIVFTDIVGYTALMGKNQAYALEILSTLSSIQDPLIAEFQGRKLKDLGDGTLISFDSSSQAVNFSIQLLKAVKPVQDLELRIGIHIGDVVFKDYDIFGDGVNVASRLESVANPGEIIISESVQRSIRGMTGVEAVYIGEKRLKNVDFTVRCYCILEKGEKRKVGMGRVSKKLYPIVAVIITLLSLGYFLSRNSQKLQTRNSSISLAVLPFSTANEEERYLSDGISMDIIHKLTKLPELKVKAYSVSKKYREYEDIAVVADNMDVSTILSGSIQKLENRLKVNLELFNVNDGELLWSDNYEVDVDDVFQMQSDIALTVADNLNIEILSSTKESIETNKNYDLTAYEYYIKGKDLIDNAGNNQQDILAAINLLERSLKLDSTIAPAYAYLGTSYGFLNQWYRNKEYSLDTAYLLIEKSISLDSTIATPYALRAILNRTNGLSTIDSIEMDIEKAIELEPNDPLTWTEYANFMMEERGDLATATELQLKGFELTKDKVDSDYLYGLSNIYYKAGLFEEAQDYLDECLLLSPNNFAYTSRQRALHIIRGDFDRALEWAKKLKEIDPEFGLGNHQLGVSYIFSGLNNEAIEELDPIAKESWVSYIYLLIAHYRNGDQASYDSLNVFANEVMIYLDTTNSVTRWEPYYYGGSVALFTNRVDQGISLLEKSVELGAALSYLKFDFDPLIDSVKNTPAYEELMVKVNDQRKINQDIIRKALFEWEASQQMGTRVQ